MHSFSILNINLLNIYFYSCKLQIWDSAGQKQFHEVTKAFYNGVHGIILMYDVTNLKSFENLSYWLTNIMQTISVTKSNVRNNYNTVVASAAAPGLSSTPPESSSIFANENLSNKNKQ